MPLDPVIQALFEQFPQLAIRPVWEKTPAEARVDFKRFCQFANPQGGAIGKTEDIKVPGPAGRPPPRKYTPGAAGGRPPPGPPPLSPRGGFFCGFAFVTSPP